METTKTTSTHAVQDIFLASLDAVLPPPGDDPMAAEESDDYHRRRHNSVSRIPIRKRDSSSPPSLAGSGRSTPVQPVPSSQWTPMRREGSSPPGLLVTPKTQLSSSTPPPIGPKPSLEKIGPKLSLQFCQGEKHVGPDPASLTPPLTQHSDLFTDLPHPPPCSWLTPCILCAP